MRGWFGDQGGVDVAACARADTVNASGADLKFQTHTLLSKSLYYTCTVCIMCTCFDASKLCIAPSLRCHLYCVPWFIRKSRNASVLILPFVNFSNILCIYTCYILFLLNLRTVGF
jgi:hypothetical protein